MASLELTKADLTQVATVSHRGTLGLFPLGRKRRQKFVVGDDTGAVSCFEMKRGAAMTVSGFPYQTLSGEPIQNVAFNRNEEKRDRVFATQGQSIFGVSKKGKEVFRLVSPSTEEIKHLVVDEVLIYSGGDFTFQLYDNGGDAGFHMSNDRIDALAVLPRGVRQGGDGATAPDCVLACADRKLRVVRPRPGGRGADLAFEQELAFQVTCLAAFGLPGVGAAQLGTG
eukprot:CAMPEP_0172612100 /NCGR_PEP_ID=MMETSP1068-20121228/31710_1 /TAXON_ID=35684 /ORGANISM="Pseudopedinella elastica, Strain CCMP716" /LENGTH=225 /DNA_ID=CAMNT_0013416245 /DNA_START=291 /DNA_END=965 /DNA_ORIENTATION=+